MRQLKTEKNKPTIKKRIGYLIIIKVNLIENNTYKQF